MSDCVETRLLSRSFGDARVHRHIYPSNDLSVGVSGISAGTGPQHRLEIKPDRFDKACSSLSSKNRSPMSIKCGSQLSQLRFGLLAQLGQTSVRRSHPLVKQRAPLRTTATRKSEQISTALLGIAPKEVPISACLAHTKHGVRSRHPNGPKNDEELSPHLNLNDRQRLTSSIPHV